MDRKIKAAFLAGCMFLFLILMVALASQPITPALSQVFAQQQAAPPTVEAKPSFYTQDIAPLTPVECARCHSSVYNQIKTEGGKHQLDCVKCHIKYHAYNPNKQNWNEIMPKCQTCHGLYHGEKVTACMDCHSEPHAPKKQITTGAELAKMCNDCHGKVAQELQQNPSKHTLVQCSMCHHDKHGYIPSCMECHKPHTSDMTIKDCLACHPAHSPINIVYGDDVRNEVCGGCHSQPFDKIKTTASRHGQVTCVKCHHNKHKYVPQCQECHGQPHGEVVLKKFPNCLQCHIDVHDLPGKGKK
jgi:hypothetical protein